MRFSYYQTSPQRINPQFVGIASKYSEHKRKRLNFERRKRELHSDVMYTTKLDESLEKALEKKLQELGRLQQARQRHLENIKYKQELQERRQAQLQRLKEKNTQSRVASKMHIEQARNHLLQRNKMTKEEIQLDLSRLSTRFEQFMENKMQTNAEKRNHIIEEKRMGRQRVDSFHRDRNRESLNSYLTKIKRERSLRKEHTKRIKAHQRNLQELSRTVEVKKQYLQQLQGEIFKYKTDLRSIVLVPQNSRKHTESLKSDSRFIPAQYSTIIDRRQMTDLQS